MWTMAHMQKGHGPSFHSPTVSELEVILEVDEEAGAERGHFGRSDPSISDTVLYQGICSLQGGVNQGRVYSYTDGVFKEGCSWRRKKLPASHSPGAGLHLV